MNKVCPVTIIIPVFNVEPYLAELLQSIVAQKHTDFLVLIGDDGSSDGTQTIAESFLHDHRFTYIRWENNRGLGAVMKELMSMVKTKYWCNPGGDDRLHPDFLSSRLEIAETADDCIMVHGVPVQIDANGNQISRIPDFDMPQKMNHHDFLELLLYHNVVINPGVMIKTSVTKQCLHAIRTDLLYAPDWYWWIHHISCKGTVFFDPVPHMDYRIHQQSLSLSPSKKWVRAEEVRRAPLLALHDASSHSNAARKMLDKYGQIMCSLWLYRMAKVFVLSKGNYRLFDIPFLPKKRFAFYTMLIVCIAKLPYYALYNRMRRNMRGFTPSGISIANHDCLKITLFN
jgi:glycosyltransferase involved in cell wall biosynthesis